MSPRFETVHALRSDVALQIARYTERLGISQLAAARRLDVPQPTLSKIVNGHICDLSLELLLRIAVRAGLRMTLQTGIIPQEAGAYLSAGRPSSAQASASKIASDSLASLRHSLRELTATQRLEAFLEHNQLASELHESARAVQAPSSPSVVHTARTTKGGQSALLLLDVVETLRREKVDYAVIGAFALTVLGVIRATTDVDALLFTNRSRLAKLEKPFKQAGFGTQFRAAEAGKPVRRMLVLSDDFGNRVELLGGLRNMDPEIFSRTLEITFRDETLRIVGREDFIAMKCFAGGTQDIIDTRSAYQAAPGPIGLDLLRTVTRRFGREAADNLEKILVG